MTNNKNTEEKLPKLKYTDDDILKAIKLAREGYYDDGYSIGMNVKFIFSNSNNDILKAIGDNE